MKKIFPLVLAFLLLLQACGSGASSTATPLQNEVVTAAPTEAPTAEPIVHTVIPQTGTRARANAHDHEESATFDRKNVTAGDEFIKNQFERPFTAGDMAYLPDLDIVDFGITSDDQFFYIKIILAGGDDAGQSASGFYGVEIDSNVDGRAEIMLETKPPYSGEFTAENVVVYVDLDGDVGGQRVTRPDEASSGNGFDGVIFDLEQNIHPQDPDLAWVRVIEGEKPAVEIAYRKWIFKDGNENFMWNVWASGAELNPLAFNLHDFISESQAGSPNKGSEDFPPKELAEFDNTCRVPLGFDAIGNEPLGCLVKGPEREPAREDGQAGNGQGAGSIFCQRFPSVCNRNLPRINDGSSNTIVIIG